MHDGNCNNCNGGLSAQQSLLVMSGIAAATAVAIIVARPHEDNTVLITFVEGLLTPMLGHLISVNKTQQVHVALCETAKASNAVKGEIKSLVLQDLAATTEVKETLAKAVVTQDAMTLKIDAQDAKAAGR